MNDRIWASTARDRTIAVVFACALAAALVVLCLTVSQPILESYGFRQAQTALTAYWFAHEGFALAYQTPVLGYPWPVPFEFPLFQAIVAAIASVTHWPLDGIGRSVSFAFFVGTLAPAAVVCRRLELGRRVFLVFGSLYLLSPLYLFWGRTFMIESAATFFSVATVAAALPLFHAATVSVRRMAGVIALASLACAVKVTTGLPVIGVLMAVLGIRTLEHWRGKQTGRARTFLVRTLLLSVSIVVALAWTHYTDVVKAQNEIGKLLTAAALPDWSVGHLRQRFSRPFIVEVLWRRCFSSNAGGFLGLGVIGFFLVEHARGARLWIALGLLALFGLPLLVFTNLHIVHTYYQSANVIYLIFLLAIALVSIAERTSPRLFVLAFGLVLVSNVAHFDRDYWRLATQDIGPANNLVLAVAQVVREQSAPEKPILVYGLDWSSELPYYAERKALAVPDWYPRYAEPLAQTERYFGGSRVGALVICPTKLPLAEDNVRRFLTAHGPFRESSTASCRIYIAAS